jgi:uncharacterized protein (DUF1499 family)
MTLEPIPTVRSARWASRIAVFSVGLLLVTLVLHRFSAMPTPLALNLFLVGLGGAGLALLVGLAATARIWFTGHAGAGSAAVGILLALAALGGPLFYAAIHYDRPWINDATTDVANPPAFAALAQRPSGANPVAYPGQAFAELQAKAYPDLRTLVLDRSVEEAFELAEEVVRRLRWRVIAEEPPMPPSAAKPAEPGIIEATEQTLMVGFTDDIVIRIEGGAKRSRIDARSASRYGAIDFGENALRLRRLMAEIRRRAELTPSAAVATGTRERTPGAAARALLKRQKARDQQKAESRNARGPAKSGAQRAPARKETPRF